MYCKNCGNKLEKSDMYCVNCGAKVDECVQLNDSEKRIGEMFKKKNDNDLSLQKILISFQGTLSLNAIFMIYCMFDSMKNSTGSNSGWFLFVMPFIIAVYLIPLVVGYVIERINLRLNKYSLSVVSFIFSCLALVSVILYKKDIGINNNIIYIIMIVQCCLLICKCINKLQKKK